MKVEVYILVDTKSVFSKIHYDNEKDLFQIEILFYKLKLHKIMRVQVFLQNGVSYHVNFEHNVEML